MLKAVIYDLDGTLIDSRADLAAAVNTTLSQLDLPAVSLERLSSFVGNGAETLVRRALAAARGSGERAEQVPQDLVRRAMPLWHAAYSAHLLDQTKLYPGIAKLVSKPTIPQAVLTNKHGSYSRRILEGLGLEHAFVKVIGGDEAARKPDPAALISLCKELGAELDEAMLIGDSPVDMATGANGGVKVCAVSWGFSSREELAASNPAYLVGSVGELAAVLAG